MPSLKAIPHGMWLGLIVVEVVCSVGLILPAAHRPAAILAPIAAMLVAAEMLLFSGIHLNAGESNHSPMIYWLVVAALCAFVALGRLVLEPL